MPRAVLARTGSSIDAAAWRAVSTRDPSARGRFVVGVVTTGIYCAPGCPARLPRRENLRLFATADDAEAAGFRACRRCDPRAAPDATVQAAVVRAGETIRTALATTRFGPLLVGATARGVCFLGFGESAASLMSDLRRRFPRAAIVEDDTALAQHVAAVLRYLDAPRAGLSLPLDLQGTAFQRRVWDALRAIAAGERRSYGEVAVALGVPRAARAVATACARNPVALAVPCHRVLGSDGRLSGYRWGLERKRILLEEEAGG